MKPIVVLDACTILNLLRIDDEADFLLKQINGWHVCLPQTVFEETKLHVRSDSCSDEKNDHILIVINTEFDYRKTLDTEIKKDLGDDEFDSIKSFSGHNKRENGELYCVALSLIKSRMEDNQVSLFTDDYKAIEEFKDYYRYQQIGIMGDTLDLLTLLYWSSPESDFQRARYRSFLENLKAEYCQQLFRVYNEISTYLDNQKKSKCKDSELLKNLSNIILGYRSANMELMDEGIRFFQQGNKYKEVKKIVEDVSVLSINKQMQRISEIFGKLKAYPIFKVA